jgi:DNA-binding NarL/FixJ family response regulator
MESDLAYGAPGQAIEAIDAFVTEVGAAWLAPDGARDHTAGNREQQLTPRELEVLRLIAGGATNHEIANKLFVSVRTVERHITHIYGKIGARGKADATAYAMRHSLI